MMLRIHRTQIQSCVSIQEIRTVFFKYDCSSGRISECTGAELPLCLLDKYWRSCNRLLCILSEAPPGLT